MVNTQGKSEFGPGHIAIIAGVILVLVFFGFQQGHIQSSSSTDNAQSALLLPMPQSDSSAIQLSQNSTANSGTPQVLGASTYNKDFVNQFNVQVQTLDDNSSAAIQNYSQQISVLAAGDKVTDGDSQHQIKFLNDVKQLAVPSSIADYQKLLIVFYQLQYLQSSGQGSASVTQLVSEVQPQLDLIRSNFDQNYSISLP